MKQTYLSGCLHATDSIMTGMRPLARHHMNRFKRVTVFVMVLAAGISVPAEVIYTATPSQESSFYNSTIDETVALSSISATGAANFTVQFSALDTTVLRIKLLLPAGMVAKVNAPVGFDQVTLQYSIRFGSGFISAGSFLDGAPSVSFIGLSGTAPSLIDRGLSLSGPGGDLASANASYLLSAGDSFSFTGFKIETTVPASYGVDFDSQTPQLSIGGTARSFNSPPDPGPWVFLSPIESSPITAFNPDGSFGFSGMPSGTVFTVQWASSMNGATNTLWQDLYTQTVTNEDMTADWPRFFRVLRQPDP